MPFGVIGLSSPDLRCQPETGCGDIEPHAEQTEIVCGVIPRPPSLYSSLEIFSRHAWTVVDDLENRVVAIRFR